MVLLLILVTLVLLALLVILVLLSNTPTKDSKKTKMTNISTPPLYEKVLGAEFSMMVFIECDVSLVISFQ